MRIDKKILAKTLLDYIAVEILTEYNKIRMQGKSGTLTAKLPEHLSKDDQAYITERVRKWIQKG